jgi:hypothetical protein
VSRRIGQVVIIEGEPDMICHLCGKVAETRPYGPNGEEICYECGQKDPLTTETQMNIRLFGDDPATAAANAKIAASERERERSAKTKREGRN